jgi:integrase
VRDFVLSLLVAGYRPATVRLALSVIRNLLNAARFEDRLLKENVAEGLSRLLPPRRGPMAERALSLEEMRRLLAVTKARGPLWLHAFLLLAVTSGARLGELLSLEWPQFDLDNRTVLLARTIDSQGRLTTPKGGKAVRLPLSDETVRALRELHGCARRGRWVFASEYNAGARPFSRTQVRRLLRLACRAANVSPHSAHATRHTFITQLGRAGVSPWDVKTLARHGSVQQTEAYMHLEVRSDHSRIIDGLGARLETLETARERRGVKGGRAHVARGCRRPLDARGPRPVKAAQRKRSAIGVGETGG